MTKSNIPVFEFSRPLQIDRVPRKGSHEHVKADPKECLALAQRLSVPAIYSVSARLLAVPWRGGGLKVTGTIEADLDQVSVISLEAFRAIVKFAVERYYLPAKALDENIEDDADPIIDGEVDLGEIVAETLGLELDPYPRRPDEVFVDQIDPN